MLISAHPTYGWINSYSVFEAHPYQPIAYYQDVVKEKRTKDFHKPLIWRQ